MSFTREEEQIEDWRSILECLELLRIEIANGEMDISIKRSLYLNGLLEDYKQRYLKEVKK